MPETLRTKIRELESKLRILEEENARLSEGAEETLLLGLVAEHIAFIGEQSALLDCVLERISILKNIPLCACYRLDDNGATCLASYASFSDIPGIPPVLTLSEELQDKLASGTVGLERNQFHDYSIFSNHDGFVPESLLVLPFSARNHPRGVFAFWSEEPLDRLSGITALLKHVIDLAVDRLDKLALLDALHEANHNLDRKVRERTTEVLKQQALLRKAQEIAKIGSWEVDLAQDRLVWSEETFRIFGFPADTQLTYNRFLQGVHPDDRQFVDARWKEATHGGPYDIEHRLVIAGDTKWVREKAELTFDEHGHCLGGIGFVQDITERKHADEEIRQLRNYLANIIDSMPSILIGVDADCMVTQWNRAAERATGLTANVAIGQAVFHVFPRLPVTIEKVRKAITTRTLFTAHRQGRNEGGETRFEDVTVYPLIANGVEGAVIRVDDVTDRVRIDEMMVQSEKMLSVGGLAAGMAHEINNPLGGMIQNSIVMNERLANLTLPANIQAAEEAGTSMEAIHAFMASRKILTMLGRIRESGARASEIVTNMLNFARKSDSSRSSCIIAQLLDQSVDLAGADYDLKKTYDFRQIEIVRHYAENLPVIPCESGKIQQVFLNILRNGAEAMHDHQWHEDRKPCFELRLAHDSQAATLRIDIEDNGPGMSEETRRRVFEPFFTTKPAGKGTGLGLSVSYFIVTENHNGRMVVESELGKGSKFSIHLPC